MKTRFFTALLALGAALGLAADVSELPTTVVGGTTFHYYQVKAKETAYSLCHKLGITHEYLVKTNPSVADGLKNGATLYFPVEQRENQHEVAKGETVYGLAQQYGVTVDDLKAANPAVADGLKAGQVVTIPSPKASYQVKPKETFYSIAREHGITVDQLEKANPTVAVLQPGQMLVIPSSSPITAQDAAPAVEPTVASQQAAEAVASTTPSTASAKQRGRIEIAVLLPFMLNQENMSKTTLRNTEFYKGLLVAVDSMRHARVPVTVRAYDTEGSTARVESILAKPELRKASVIIAPDNAEQLSLISRFGRTHSILVYNPFSVRDASYKTNPVMMQPNIPSHLLTANAAKALAGRYAHYTPVFLARTGGADDKADFVEAAKKELASRGVDWIDLKFDGKLNRNDLAELDSYDTQYIFIPLSGKQAEANRIMPGLIDWRDQREEADKGRIRIFGYPEWVTFRGESLQNMHNLGAVIYSRFDANPRTLRAQEVDQKFRHFYGAPTEIETPRQGFMGFDTGMYLIEALNSAAPEDVSYLGIQNPIHLSKNGGLGWHNKVLYLLSYRPGGILEAIPIND